MFENQRVITSGISQKLSLAGQNKIWDELEVRKIKDPNLDYLQVFRVAGHEIWVIDDGTATTMLFPDEY